jgi:predicted metal-dependent hydrolase
VSDTLSIGDLDFEVRRSDRRRSVQITVDRGGELVLSAPANCSTDVMENFVREKRSWIYTKLAEKEALRSEAPPKEYVSGEGFPYLGRSYRLLLVDDEQDVPLKLERGRFRLRRADASEGRQHFVAWYTDHAQRWLEKRVGRWEERIGVEATSIEVRDLGYRWGSCGKHGRLYFHWRSALLPPSLVDYVLAHELVHLREPHHTPIFWRMLERSMPNCLRRIEAIRVGKWGRVGL